jgi:hypothetical protein
MTTKLQAKQAYLFICCLTEIGGLECLVLGNDYPLPYIKQKLVNAGNAERESSFLIEVVFALFDYCVFEVEETRSDIRHSGFTRPNPPFLAENSSNF